MYFKVSSISQPFCSGFTASIYLESLSVSMWIWYHMGHIHSNTMLQACNEQNKNKLKIAEIPKLPHPVSHYG